MSRRNKSSLFTTLFALLAVSVAFAAPLRNRRPDWVEKKVNLRLNSRTKIKAIRHPKDKSAPRTLSEYKADRIRKKAAPETTAPTTNATAAAIANIIDSPPVDGFIPWVAVIVTDQRSAELELEAIPTTSVIGSYPPGYDPQTEYAIGIYDTGASAHVMGNADAVQSGLFSGYPDLVSANPIDITGVNGYVTANVSMPLGVFIDGLNALDPAGTFTNTSGVVGQTNVSIVVGAPVTPPTPDLPTAIGSPLAAYFTAVMKNDQPVTISRGPDQFTAPSINFYESDDPAIPNYSRTIPLELRPLGGINVQYIPYLNFYDIFADLFDLDFSTPQSPSTIIGQQSQSVFFVHSVDLSDNSRTAADKNRFLLDTGAQVTVVGSRIGARLGLDPANPDFEVEIQGVTGYPQDKPGFFIDSLQIPALGGWLQYTNTPVVLLDVFSPEGGTVDGIIGTNLFVDFNLVLRGGGLFLYDDPALMLEPIEHTLAGDVAPPAGDGIINYADLSVFTQAWLSDPNTPNWNPNCDIAPLYGHDKKINALDLALLARNWLKSPNP